MNSASGWIFLLVFVKGGKQQSESLYSNFLFHSNHPHRHDDLRETFLPLDSQDLQASHDNDAPHDVEVATDAAVDWVQFAALPCHIVLYYNDTVWTQAFLTANQKVH